MVAAMVRPMGVHKTANGMSQKRISILKLLRDHPDFGAAGQNRTVAASEITVQLETSRAKCREWAQRFDDARRTSTAASFTSAALLALAHELQANRELSEPQIDHALLDRDAIALAESIGREAARLPLTQALYFITSLYPALIPQHTRGRLGAFYTPPALTRRLVELLSEHGVDWATAKVFDPAAGAGAFMLEAAQMMLAAISRSEPAFVLRQLGTRLRGNEIDPHAAHLAQSSLEILLADIIRAAGQPAPQFVRVCDSLEETATEEFDVVLGNPPYGRVSLSSDQRGKFRRSLYGHANLYGVFTDLALRWTKPGGMVAFLTPTSFLAGRYFAALRKLLGADAPPLSIDFVHARKGVFEDVQQETLLAVYKKGARRGGIQIHYLDLGTSLDARVTKNGKVALPADPTAPWLAPRSPAHGPLITRAERMPARLASWGYSVSTGPLVWNRFKPQLCSQAEPGTLPLVWAESVSPEGKFEFRAQKPNHAPFFRVQPGDEWLIVRQPCVLVQRTTAKEQSRRLIAAELPTDLIEKHGGIVVENHLNMVRPGASSRVSPATVAALLNSEVVDQLFRCMNGSVAVSAFELEALPLPDATALTDLIRLVREGAPRQLIEAECSRLYGVAL